MDHVMTTNSLPWAEMPRGRSAVQQRKIENALNAFPHKYRAYIKREASQEPKLADLALSFPALLFVIAVPHPGMDANELRQQVIAGKPLKFFFKTAGLPLWLRKLQPQAFEDLLVHVPCGELVWRQITNFIPSKSKHQARWLRQVSYCLRWGHEAFALWVARIGKISIGKREPYRLNMLSLWAWYSHHPQTEFGRLVQKRWRIDMDWNQVTMACNSWIESVNLHLQVHIETRSPKLIAFAVDGFDFVHLATGEMLADEAVAMRNCIKTYGHDIAARDNELWSMRRNGLGGCHLVHRRKRC
jgi:hypothetical protein